MKKMIVAVMILFESQQMLAVKTTDHFSAGAIDGSTVQQLNTQTQTDMQNSTFISVSIASHPRDGGFASKSVDSSGATEGTHLSGDPEMPRVFMSRDQVTVEDLQSLRMLVGRLVARAPEDSLTSEMKELGYKSVTVLFVDKELSMYAVWGFEFEFQEANALWDLIYKQNVGGW